jgi:hypothetical protein
MNSIVINDDISPLKHIEILTDGSPKQIRKKRKGRTLPKIKENEFVIPRFENYNLFMTHKYNIKNLKEICKYYKQKKSGNKDELVARIYNYLHQSYFANKIQICWRNYVVKIYDRLHGPARRNRNLCVNETDFYTMEKISNISYNQFISYEDVDKMIYGFDILSLYNLLTKKNGITEYTNPYNRNSIPYDLRRNIDRLILFSKIIGEKITVKIDEPEEISTIKRLELKTLSIFHDIDNLGNYTDKNWFWSLDKIHLIRFIRELTDIWMYRAELSLETKREICPPVGNPFAEINVNYINNLSMLDVKIIALKIIEKFVRRGINDASKCLGANFVLCALTLVNNDAANALPWLYQSVSHI